MEKIRGFQDVVGHRDIIAHMQNAIRLNKVSHAYIIGGEEGSGKKMLANLFAMTLQCKEGGVEPCMNCISCKKALSGNHPDIIRVAHEKPNSIGIDDIRNQLVNDVSIRPYESPRKIYIVDEAEKMTPQAQNALLKTIEEPPGYVTILFLSNNPGLFLQTITSRCVMLKLKPVSDQAVRDYLVKTMQVPDYQADVQASFARGIIGRAIKMAESQEFNELTQNALRLLKQSKDMEVYELVDAIKSMTADKQNVYQYLELFTMWFRDVLLFKATKEVDDLIFKAEFNYIKERAAVSSYRGLEAILEAIRVAETRLHANVNFDLTMELLFLSIREN